MKKILLVLFVVFVACSPLTSSIEPSKTPTKRVVPTKTVTPTRTPILVTLTPTTSPTATPTPELFYTVKTGNTLSKIANDNGVSVVYLADINGINNPNFISVGQILKLNGKQFVPTPDVVVGKEIVVILSKQRTYAFEDGVLIKEFIVSTGTDKHPTVIGKFEIAVKYRYAYMTDGVTYFLPNVPFTMYFGNDVISWHEGYSFHGTYWHSNFGTQMSHGCVNMYTPDAEWLYNWASVGTAVLIIE